MDVLSNGTARWRIVAAAASTSGTAARRSIAASQMSIAATASTADASSAAPFVFQNGHVKWFVQIDRSRFSRIRRSRRGNFLCRRRIRANFIELFRKLFFFGYCIFVDQFFSFRSRTFLRSCASTSTVGRWNRFDFSDRRFRFRFRFRRRAQSSKTSIVAIFQFPGVDGDFLRTRLPSDPFFCRHFRLDSTKCRLKMMKFFGIALNG